jgi:CHAT domain
MEFGMFHQTQLPSTPIVGLIPISFPLRVFVAVYEPAITASEPAYDFKSGMATIFGAIDAARHQEDVVELEPPQIIFTAGVPVGTISAGAASKRYDVVYLRTAIGPDGPSVGLSDELLLAKTRLLILHVSNAEVANAKKLGEAVTLAGGPTVIVVACGSAKATSDFFSALFEQILSDSEITLAARTAYSRCASTASVDVFTGSGGDSLLAHEPLIQLLTTGILTRRIRSKVLRDQIYATKEAVRPYVHDDQLASAFEPATSLIDYIDAATGYTEDIVASAKELRVGSSPLRAVQAANAQSSLSALDGWLDHSGAGISLLRQSLQPVEGFHRSRFADLSLHETTPPVTKSIADILTTLIEHARNAPRVLNAAFVDRESKPVDRRLAFVEGCRYALLADIGPRWDVLESIVEGNAAFPERALDVDEGQTSVLLDLVLVSEDVDERVAFAQFVLPVLSGRSSPAGAGLSPGPIAIPFTVRKDESAPDTRPFLGRVLVYQGSNVLQSGTVEATIGRAEGTIGVPMRIALDYALSGGFRDLPQIDSRSMRSSVDSDLEEVSVGFNITLNDDGAEGHRIIIKGDPAGPPVFRPYDPGAGTQLLDDARGELLNCFFARTQNCDPSNSPGLLADNARSYADFRCDLYRLALLGQKLYFSTFLEASSADPTFLQMMRRIRARLRATTVIQVANAGPSQFVLPWALFYDYLLPDTNALHYCPVVAEWEGAGETGPSARSAVPGASCPYDNGDPAHLKNVLCPYGFWGLRHFIEQPLSALGRTGAVETPRKVPLGNGFELSVGLSRDPALDVCVIQRHIDDLARFATFSPSTFADTWSLVQAMLESPSFVYFLCHGEFDPAQHAPYLGVGLRDGNAIHRVYPQNLAAWAVDANPDWSDRAPLVFINGCETAQLTPSQIMNFVRTFSTIGASSVVGTEVSVRLPVATEMAYAILERLHGGASLGIAVRDARWQLANKGNLLGLAYTPYGLIDVAAVASQTASPQPPPRTSSSTILAATIERGTATA